MPWSRLAHAAPDPEAILARRPFASVARLVALQPIAEDEAHSGRAFRARAADGRVYKLRACESARRAREIEEHLRLVPGLVPRLIAREGPLLLIEFIDGERVGERKDLRPYAARLGQVFAELHTRGALRGLRGWLRGALEVARIRVNFVRHLRMLRRAGVLSPDEARLVARAWRAWRVRHGIPIALDLHDTGKANFMLDADGRLRYVDEDGLGYTLRGMGLAKLHPAIALRRGHKRKREWHEFRGGYARCADPDFLTPDYADYARVLELVRGLASRLRRNARPQGASDEVEELRTLLVGVKAPDDSSDPSVAA